MNRLFRSAWKEMEAHGWSVATHKDGELFLMPDVSFFKFTVDVNAFTTRRRAVVHAAECFASSNQPSGHRLWDAVWTFMQETKRGTTVQIHGISIFIAPIVPKHVDCTKETMFGSKCAAVLHFLRQVLKDSSVDGAYLSLQAPSPPIAQCGVINESPKSLALSPSTIAAADATSVKQPFHAIWGVLKQWHWRAGHDGCLYTSPNGDIFATQADLLQHLTASGLIHHIHAALGDEFVVSSGTKRPASAIEASSVEDTSPPSKKAKMALLPPSRLVFCEIEGVLLDELRWKAVVDVTLGVVYCKPHVVLTGKRKKKWTGEHGVNVFFGRDELEAHVRGDAALMAQIQAALVARRAKHDTLTTTLVKDKDRDFDAKWVALQALGWFEKKTAQRVVFCSPDRRVRLSKTEVIRRTVAELVDQATRQASVARNEPTTEVPFDTTNDAATTNQTPKKVLVRRVRQKPVVLPTSKKTKPPPLQNAPTLPDDVANNCLTPSMTPAQDPIHTHASQQSASEERIPDVAPHAANDGVPPIARPLDIDSTPLTSVSTDSFSDSDHGTTEARQTALHLAMQVLGPDYVLDDATHLVHREAEWCTLEWFAATCEQPQRQAVFLVGPRGTGKSTMAHLLTHALQATWASKRVVQLDASEVGDASSLYMAIAARVTSSPDHASVSHAIAALKIAFT
ncbi:hypothetical protein As57867_023010, partial [Aphanomyces stellatus]